MLESPELTPASAELLAKLMPKYPETTNASADRLVWERTNRAAKIICEVAPKHLCQARAWNREETLRKRLKCNLKTAAKRIWWGKLINSGQRTSKMSAWRLSRMLNTDEPLDIYIFSNGDKVKRRITDSTRRGTVNETIIHVMTNDAPFGGVGASGCRHAILNVNHGLPRDIHIRPQTGTQRERLHSTSSHASDAQWTDLTGGTRYPILWLTRYVGWNIQKCRLDTLRIMPSGSLNMLLHPRLPPRDGRRSKTRTLTCYLGLCLTGAACAILLL
ncbi:hypothetical protein C8Q72DRAFT_798876 [Fomitopsis betulina]|nr:hypothetical protein C8Q72DRAFT_798876 [Fomitopsis betulina]